MGISDTLMIAWWAMDKGVGMMELELELGCHGMGWDGF